MSGPILFYDESAGGAILGGKAAALRELNAFDVPPWFAVPPAAEVSDDSLIEACQRISSGQDRFAVRSSAVGEDAQGHSYAGQFESYLRIAAEEVPEHVRMVRASCESARLETYSRERGTRDSLLMAVLVQPMIDPVCAGVAFAVDPVTGDDTVIISAVEGTAERLVAGEVSGETARVHPGGKVSGRESGVSLIIDDDLATRIARLTRDVSIARGSPQDIEWAWDGRKLWLLQARPITTALTGELAVWDNSNIAESYAGVTTPLTFSFASRAYEEVYKTFCKLMGVGSRAIEARSDMFANMLGFHEGRIYYNLMNWYRLVAMLPGYSVNARFMEQMMGVESSLPDEAVRTLREEAAVAKRAPTARLMAGGRFVLSIGSIAYRHLTLGARITRFNQMIKATLRDGDDPFAGRSAIQLVAEYRMLEDTLLPGWDAPILNDFFAMIYVGLLRKLCESIDEDGESLHNDLLLGIGDIISVQPARRIEAMAADVRAVGQELRQTLADARSVHELAQWPTTQRQTETYIREFGDRCLQELKLETPTLRDDPTPLFRSVAAMAGRTARAERTESAESPDTRLHRLLRGKPLKSLEASFIVPRARIRVRDRENLRFARTRVFGYVRRLFVALGERYREAGLIDEARDVFYLEVEELLALAEPGAGDPRPSIEARRAQFERRRAEPPPPDRFETRGPTEPLNPIVRPRPATVESEPGLLRGVGCCPGVVRGRARIVTDPIGVKLDPGDVLIAARTDPGWVMLFPAASAIAVEHGSILSHTSIVARELGLTCAVGVRGLLDAANEGDTVEIDGSSGIVRIVEPAS
ncbi:MAG: PEP/pyruvate-binding domain-containing protein [Planctomycetota bacterium]